VRGFRKTDRVFASRRSTSGKALEMQREIWGDKPLIHVASPAGGLYQGRVKARPGENTEWLATTEQ